MTPMSRRIVLSVLLAAAPSVSAAGWRSPRFCPPQPCPCPCPEELTIEEQPVTPMPEEMPVAPSPDEPATPMPEAPDTTAEMEDALTASYDVAASSDLVAPNMYGDSLMGSIASINLQFTEPGALNGLPFILRAQPALPDPPPSLTQVLVANQAGGTGQPIGTLQILTQGLPPFPQPATALNFPDPTYRGIEQTVANVNFAGPITASGGTLATVNLILDSDPIKGAIVAQLGLVERNLDPTGFVGMNETLSGASIDGTGNYTNLGFDNPTFALDYNGTYRSFVVREITLLVPTPGDGGVVGRTKIADDNSPLPRDRFIFNYDYFNSVPLTKNGWDVQRFSPGFEKTFFNRMASVEVRFPFASTLDSNFLQGAESSNMEFGDINITLKGLLIAGDKLNVAGGLGIAVPTADDVNVGLANGFDLVRVENEAVFLTPYVAGLWTPNRRCFAQAWMQFSFDANGNPVFLDTTGAGLARIGRLSSQTLMQLDGQIGYWLYSKPEARGCQLAGLAPFVELHYNTTVEDANVIESQGVTVGSLGGRVDELNLTAGIVAQMGNNLNVNVGCVAPLRDDFDRFFDYQVGVRANYFFGPTARARDLATRVSNF